MMHQDDLRYEQFYRFELMPNSSIVASEKAFNFYGILMIPSLIGSFLMYNIFELKGNYFIVSFLVFTVILVNIYFFYQGMLKKENIIKLIIQGNYIQLLDQERIYFQEELQRVNIEKMKCGKTLYPSIKLSSEGFQGLTIGLKQTDENFHSEINNQLRRPDYWLKSKAHSKTLVELLNSIEIV